MLATCTTAEVITAVFAGIAALIAAGSGSYVAVINARTKQTDVKVQQTSARVDDHANQLRAIKSGATALKQTAPNVGTRKHPHA